MEKKPGGLRPASKSKMRNRPFFTQSIGKHTASRSTTDDNIVKTVFKALVRSHKVISAAAYDVYYPDTAEPNLQVFLQTRLSKAARWSVR